MIANLKPASAIPEAGSSEVEWRRDWHADCAALIGEASGVQHNASTPATLPRSAAPAHAKPRRSFFRL